MLRGAQFRNNILYFDGCILLDAFVAAAALIVATPLFLVIAAAIVVDSGRPVLFLQERLGRHLRPFRCFKFRTMVDGSESERWTLPGDPRITRVGRFLRRAHLDELPQLWNVLRGEMAIVGPRPLRFHVAAELQALDHPRWSVRPGITGWAQIKNGPTVTVEEQRAKFALDAEYVTMRSVRLNLWIMLHTVALLLRMRGI